LLSIFCHGIPINQEVEAGDKVGSDEPMLNAGFFGGDMAGFNPSTVRNGIIGANYLWPGGVVPYVIDNSLSGARTQIQQAMNHYHQHTCIRFRPRTNENNYIYITAESGCWSYVGRQHGAQKLSLGQGCVYLGTIIHELLHAVGFYHEQNRPDRDSYIRINYNNIQPGQEHNFRKFGTNEVSLHNERYDITSIMQYGEYAFSKANAGPTIQSLNGQRLQDAWQKSGLSASDKRRIHSMYKCY
jgi:hypothetical protein